MFSVLSSLFTGLKMSIVRLTNIIAGDNGILAMGEKCTELGNKQLDIYIAEKLKELPEAETEKLPE